ERRGDVYVVNGTKMFITNGNIADYCLVAAYTEPAKRGSGISMFIVDTGTPGFSVSRKLKKTGHHTSETAALSFDDMQVPAAALLGGVEGGFKQVTGTLEGGRITHAARSVGVSQAALEAALKYAREREQFGQPIARFQAIKFKLARMAMEVETARTMTWRAAWLFDQGYSMREAAMAKLFASEVAQRVTWEAVQIHGGYGYITEFPVERFWRDGGPLRQRSPDARSARGAPGDAGARARSAHAGDRPLALRGRGARGAPRPRGARARLLHARRRPARLPPRRRPHAGRAAHEPR